MKLIKKFNENYSKSIAEQLQEVKDAFANLMDEYPGSYIRSNLNSNIVVAIKSDKPLSTDSSIYFTTEKVEKFLNTLNDIKDCLSLLAMNGDYYHYYRNSDESITLFLSSNPAIDGTKIEIK